MVERLERVLIDPPIPAEAMHYPNMEGKHILVNGGTRGIGLSVAQLAAECGASITVVGRYPVDCVFPSISADLTREADVYRVFTSTPAPDYIFNNVGLYHKGEIADTSLNDFRNVMEQNLISSFLLTRAALRYAPDGATIVNMASRPTLDKYHSWSAYTLAKQGVITLTQSAAEEGEYRGIKAYALCPSRVDTSFRDRLFPDEDKSTRLSPHETAQVTMFLMNRTLPSGGHYWIKKLYG